MPRKKKQEEPQKEGLGFEVEIEDDVPVRGERGMSEKTKKLYTLLTSLEVNQSFSIPLEGNEYLRTKIMGVAKKVNEEDPDRQFCSRRTHENGELKCRFWRIEPTEYEEEEEEE